MPQSPGSLCMYPGNKIKPSHSRDMDHTSKYNDNQCKHTKRCTLKKTQCRLNTAKGEGVEWTTGKLNRVVDEKCKVQSAAQGIFQKFTRDSTSPYTIFFFIIQKGSTHHRSLSQPTFEDGFHFVLTTCLLLVCLQANTTCVTYLARVLGYLNMSLSARASKTAFFDLLHA